MMNRQEENALSIRFTFQNNRLNISKEVLRSAGNPKYIQIFVSRDRKSFYIKGCNIKETECFTVPPRVYADSEYKYVLRKAAFSEAIRLITGWEKQGRYRICGVLISPQILRFSFDNAVRLDGDI